MDAAGSSRNVGAFQYGVTFHNTIIFEIQTVEKPNLSQFLNFHEEL
jgi:hypothetical protein